MKKAIGSGSGNTQSPGLMPGMGNPGMMAGGMGMPPRSGTPDNPVGAPPSIVSTQEAFGNPGTLPTPDPSLMPRRNVVSSGNGCSSCGAELRPNAKFCTKCGSKA